MKAWTERLTEYLRGKSVTGVAFYHGGMEHEERMLIPATVYERSIAACNMYKCIWYGGK